MLENSSQDRSPMVASSKRARSAMTNGAILPGQGRSAWARRLRDLIELHVADLGGIDNVSEARMEATFAVAEGASERALEVYQRAANTMRRLLEAVGLQRRPRDVTPTLTEYLRSARSATADAEPDAAPPTAVLPRIAPNELPGVQMPDDAEKAVGSGSSHDSGLGNEGGAA
jgi:hypothetical protein